MALMEGRDDGFHKKKRR